MTEKNNSDYRDLGARPIDALPNLLHATRVPKLAYSMTQYRLLVISQNNRVEAQLSGTLRNDSLSQLSCLLLRTFKTCSFKHGAPTEDVKHSVI